MPKTCPDDKILNPETGRCVKKDGKIGKQLLKQTKKKTDETEKKKKDKKSPVKETPKKSKNCFDSDLTDYTKLSSKISSVKGKSSSSSSTSDIYVITLDDKREAYMKVFSMDDDVSHVNLKYEFVVYILRIKFLSILCPNFVTPLAGKIDSNFHEIINYLDKKVKDDKTNDILTTDELVHRFHRNITLANISELATIPKRPSIGKDMYKNKYGYIVTGPSVADASHLTRVVSLRNFIDSNYSMYESKVWEIITQIAVACYLMNLTELVHNDLHPGNILLYVYDKPKNIQYNLGTKLKPYTIRISTPYVIKIYDFDRSNLYDNTGAYPNSFTKNMISSGQDHLNIDMKDFVKALCYLPDTRTFNKSALILKNKSFFNDYNKLFDKDCFFKRYYLDTITWVKKFDIFHPIDQVLQKISRDHSLNSSSTFEEYDLYSDVVKKEVRIYERDILEVCKDKSTLFTSFLNL
jgi:hypothetical protein